MITAGRSWWNSIPYVAHLNYAISYENNFYNVGVPIQSCNRNYNFKQRKQKAKENVQEFSEAYLILLDQLCPSLSKEAAIAMFEGKLHKDISTALAGNRFDTLQEAIQKAQTVEVKQLRCEVHQSFAGNCTHFQIRIVRSYN